MPSFKVLAPSRSRQTRLSWLGLLAPALLLAPVLGIAQDFRIDSVGGREAAANEVLVKFRQPEGISAQQITANVQQAVLGLQAESMLPVGRGGALRIRSASLSVEQLINQLQQNPQVEWAEPNYIIRANDTIPTDPLLPSQWGMLNTGQIIGGQAGVVQADIGVTKAWDKTIGSASIAVGLLDTGVDWTHADLGANVWTSATAYDITIGTTTYHCPAGSHGFNAHSLTCDPFDDSAHGTHVAGTIGAVGNNANGVSGVNWKTSIVALKMLNQFGTGSEAEAVNAIEAAIQLKALGVNIRVLNASWGGGAVSTPLKMAIQDAQAQDILFVAAAGNDSGDLETLPYYPAAYTLSNIIAVAATDNRDNLAGFSNFGAVSVDLGAPGVNIISTIPTNTYTFGSGTSMATAHVTGAAALLLSACTLTTTQLRDALLNNTDAVPSLTSKTVSGGRLNVNKALNSCAGSAQPDFTLSSNALPLSIIAPGSASTTISVNALNGFGGVVTLSVLGLPSGLTAGFVPPTVTGSGPTTLTLTAVAGTAVGTYPLIVKGTSGALSATTLVTVQITGKDFLMAAGVSSLTIAQGGSASTSVTVTPISGFNGTVDLSVDGLPAGVTVVVTPPSILNGSGSAGLVFSATPLTVPGIYTLTIRGISSLLMHSVNLQLKVLPPPDFTLSVVPPAVALAVGAPATAIVSTTALYQFNGSVALSVIGLPPGVTGSFNPASIMGTGSSTLTLNSTGAVTAGTYPITVQGISGALSHTTMFNLTMASALPKITLSAPATLLVGDQAQVGIFLDQSMPGGVNVDLMLSNPMLASLNLSSTFIPGGQVSNGRARVTGLSAGLVTITATAPGYQPGTVQIQINGIAPPPLIITTAGLATGQTNVFYSQQLTASGGTPTLTWQLIGGTLPTGMMFSPSGLLFGTVTSAVAGLPLTFKVTDSGSPAQTAMATFALTITAPAPPTPASVQVFSGSGQTTAVSTPFTFPLVAIVRDGSSNPLSGVPVTFTAPASGASGMFPGGLLTITVTTGVGGLASTTITANGTVGAYSVQATVASVAVPAVFALANTAVGPPPPSPLPKITLDVAPSTNIGTPTRVAVFLSAPAPAGGLTVNLALSNPAAGSLNQTSTFIPEGQSSTGRPNFLPAATGPVTITASAPGYMDGTANVMVNP